MTLPFVKRYLMAFGRHRWAGITGMVATTALAGVVAVQPQPPVFHKAQGILVYVPPPVTFSSTAASIQQQAQAVTGSGLISDEVINAVSQALASQNYRVSPRTLRRHVKAKVTTETMLQVDVAYLDQDKKRAELINGLFMDALVEQSRVFNTIQLTRMKENLNALLPQVNAEVKQAEADLEHYIRTEAPLLASARDGTLINSISASQQSQRELQLALAGLETQLATLQSRLGLTPDQAYASSALSADPIIANLRAQLYQNESQAAILGQRLQPEHPQMVELSNQKKAYDELLRQRVTEVIGGEDGAAPLQSTEQIRQRSSLDPARQQLANQLVTLHAERERQQQVLESQQALEQQLRTEYAQLPNKQIKQAELAQELSLKQAFYNEIQARLADVTLAEKEVVGSLVVAQSPRIEGDAEQPMGPLAILLVGSVIGVFVGGAVVFLLDSADPVFHMPSDVQAMLRQYEVPILGILPHLDSELITSEHSSSEYITEHSASEYSASEDAAGASHAHFIVSNSPELSSNPNSLALMTAPESPYLDFFERFRSNLQRTGGEHSPKVVLITSTVSQEGKTATAYNLAIASARAGKQTLLIEADLRSPSHAHLLDLEPITLESGNLESERSPLADPLQSHNHLSQGAIRSVPSIAHLHLLPNPGIYPHPAAVLESGEMHSILEWAREHFDLVILDSPALSRSNDALLLEPDTDGLILVTRPAYTEKAVLTDILEQLMEAETTNIPILGAVINDVDLKLPTSEDDHSNRYSRHQLIDVAPVSSDAVEHVNAFSGVSDSIGKDASTTSDAPTDEAASIDDSGSAADSAAVNVHR